jgi:membrane protease YdiL (CAAX protease family)
MQAGECQATPAARGWYRDPWQQADWRWFDGRSWTPYVAGAAWASPREPAKTRPVVPTLPLPAAWAAIAVLAAVTIIDRAVASLLTTLTVPDVVRYLLPFSIYGLLTVAAVLIVRWHRPGMRFVESVGARSKPVDIAWGAVWMIAARIAATIVGVVIVVGRVPFRTNLPFDPHADRFRPQLSGFLVLIVVAVVIAPIVEEIVFRGVLLRALRSRLSVAPAVVIQGVVFGASHASLAYGAGNLGLILVLSAMGVTFGFAAERAGRLGPSMWAHAMVNATAIALAWLVLR